MCWRLIHVVADNTDSWNSMFDFVRKIEELIADFCKPLGHYIDERNYRFEHLEAVKMCIMSWKVIDENSYSRKKEISVFESFLREIWPYIRWYHSWPQEEVFYQWSMVWKNRITWNSGTQFSRFFEKFTLLDDGCW